MPQLQGLEPGVYPDLSMFDYHRDPAIGSSGIKKLLVSPRRYWFNSPLNPNWKQKQDTKALKFGRAYHALILEPETFEQRVIVRPDSWPTKKECGVSIEEQKASWDAQHAHMIVVTQDEIEKMRDMLFALEAEPAHLNALKQGMPEVSIFWRDEETGLMCKIRPDRFAPTYVPDLKSTASIEPNNLRYEFPKRGYDVSGCMYSVGMQELKKMIRAGYKMPDVFSQAFVDEFVAQEKQHFCIVWQEKEVPYITRLWRQTPFTNETGYHKFRKGLYVYYDHKDNPNPWPSGFDVVEDITEDMVSASINY